MVTRRAVAFVFSLLLIGLTLSTSPFAPGGGVSSSVAASGKPPGIKVTAPPGVLDASQGEIELIHDYGSFAIYLVTDRGLAGLPANTRSQVQVENDMDLMLFDAYPFNTQSGRLDFPENLTIAKPGGPGLHLVQFAGPIVDEWLKAIQEAGAMPVQYIANNGYLVWTDDNGRARLDSLAAQGKFLQFSEPYHPYFKLGPSLFTRLASPAALEEVVPVEIQMVRHPGQKETEAIIAGLTVEWLADWSPILAYQNARLSLHLRDVVRIAQLPDVYWIGEVFERTLNDEVQNQILAGNFDGSQSGPSGPGYLSWLESYGFSQDPADYPIVDIVDDGIGNGLVNSGDYTLHQFGNLANPTRLVYINNCTAASDGSGPDGHGHINVSIAGGYDTTSGFPFRDPLGFQRGLGVNPYGRFAGTRIFSPSFSLSNCGGTDTGLIKKVQDSGAHISSNSWGCSGCAATYDSASQAFDVGVRDADLSEAGNQQLIFIFSAGNSGSGASTIGTPGNGKNMITVGASENDRATDEDGNWTDGCAIGPTGADNAMDVISFSSRGPAPGGRVKPEVIAPGTHIQGTASTNAGYNGSGVCDKYRPSGQTWFAASSGTSHSTPAVSGVASLAYWWLGNTYGLTPTPALMKAYLIAHPTYLTGASANDMLPSNSQGYGMPNMGLMFDDTDKFLLNQTHIFGNSGETWTWTGGVADPSKPVYVVMAYTDAAGAIGTSPQVNNLNLAAEVGGSQYLGNVFTGQWSTTGGAADSANNYEAVFLPPGTNGGIEITITAQNIAGDGVPNSGDGTDQDFALVCYNCTVEPGFTLVAAPAEQSICTPDNALYDLTIGQIQGFTSPVALSASGAPAGTTASFNLNPVTPPGSTTLTIGNTSGATPGTYTIDISGTAPGKMHTAQVALDVYSTSPGQPPLLSPVNGATGEPVRPTFTWTDASQAGSYLLEIATDSSFVNTVLTSTVTAPSFTPGADLDRATLYFWRVQASNSCGDGAVSQTRKFITAAAPGGCEFGTGALVHFSEDFESGSGDWTHSGTGDTWALSSARTHSGTNAYKAVNPATVSDQRLVSPAVSLPSGQDPLTLYFWNHQTMEDRVGGCFDGGILEVSPDGGGSWTQVPNASLLTDPYDGPVSASFSNPLGGKDAWCGDPQDWLNSAVDLQDYAGQTVNFRFRLGSDSSFSREGWYIDDVHVQSCTVSYQAALGPSSLKSGQPGASVVHTFTLDNLSAGDSYTLNVSGNDWPTTLLTASPLIVASAESATVQVRVDIPQANLNAVVGSDVFTLAATSTGEPSLAVSATGTTNAIAEPSVGLSAAGPSYGSPGSNALTVLTITNTGISSDSFTVAAAGLWTASLSANQTGSLAPGESSQVILSVAVPAGKPEGEYDTTTVTVASQLDSSVTASAQVTTYSQWPRFYLPVVSR